MCAALSRRVGYDRLRFLRRHPRLLRCGPAARRPASALVFDYLYGALLYTTRLTIPARATRAGGGGAAPADARKVAPHSPQRGPDARRSGQRGGAGASCHDFVFEKEHPPTHTATGSLNVLDTGPDTHTVTLSTPHSARGLSTCRQSRALTARLEPLRLFDGVSKAARAVMSELNCPSPNSYFPHSEVGRRASADARHLRITGHRTTPHTGHTPDLRAPPMAPPARVRMISIRASR